MPTLIRRDANGGFAVAADSYVTLGEADPAPEAGGVILPLSRLAVEWDALKPESRPVGALWQVDDALKALLPLLPQLSLVALNFPKYRDGRAYSAAALLRARHGFTGQLRAVGEVLVEQAPQMIRCGFDAYVVADGSTPEQWAAKARLHRHVYQTAEDGRVPAYAERARAATLG
jgi:uncharacterized protein (DUF934 family)